MQSPVQRSHLSDPVFAKVTKLRHHTLYNLTSSRQTIVLHASTVIHTTVVKSMTECKSELVMGGMSDTNSRKEVNRVFLNSKSVTRKLPKDGAEQVVS